jgi:polar amino acid transport system substrate-binding protein
MASAPDRAVARLDGPMTARHHSIANGRRGAGRSRWLVGLLLPAALSLTIAAGRPAAADADALDQIKMRGVLVVGTKADYQPFGFRDSNGAIVGFEPDLARDIASVLGVRLELVPVTATNRIVLLADGKLDLVIATMNDTPERRKQVDFVQPSYYASGVNVLAPKLLQVHVWQQLRGKQICTIEGAFYVEEIKRRYEPELVTFANTGDMYDALLRGRCLAVVYDDTAIIGKLQSPDWRAFEMPLRSILVEPWGMAVRPGEARLEQVLSDCVREWHHSGRIVALEERWNIPKSGFAAEMRQKYAEDQ